MTEPLDFEFLERARRGASPSTEDRARVLAATLKALGADAGASAAEQQPLGAAEAVPQSFLARAAHGLVAKIALAGLISGVSGGVGYWLGWSDGARDFARARDARERLAVVSAPSALPPASTWRVAPGTSSAVGALPESPDASPAPSRAAAARTRASASVTTDVGGSPSARADEELRLLRRVQRALSDANPRLALALLAELDQLAPRSKLLEEREAAAVMARCQLEADEATRATSVRAFERRYPRSLYTTRIRQTCAPPASLERNTD